MSIPIQCTFGVCVTGLGDTYGLCFLYDRRGCSCTNPSDSCLTRSALDDNKNAQLSGPTFGTCELLTCTGSGATESCGTKNIHDTCAIACDETFYLPGDATIYKWYAPER